MDMIKVYINSNYGEDTLFMGKIIVLYINLL